MARLSALEFWTAHCWGLPSPRGTVTTLTEGRERKTPRSNPRATLSSGPPVTTRIVSVARDDRATKLPASSPPCSSSKESVRTFGNVVVPSTIVKGRKRSFVAASSQPDAANDPTQIVTFARFVTTSFTCAKVSACVNRIPQTAREPLPRSEPSRISSIRDESEFMIEND